MRPMSAIEIAHERGYGYETITVGGELDLTTVDALELAIGETIARAVIVDLAGLGFVDSTGMRSVDQAHRRLAGAGRILLIVAPPDSTAGWTFRIAGFEEGHVLDSLEAAVARVTDDGL